MFNLVYLPIPVSRTVRLNNGRDVPVIGLGTGGYRAGGPPQDKLVKQMIKDAIDLGYRHIDTASAYFNEAAIGQAVNEAAIGQAVNEAIIEGKVKREDMFITTKIFGRMDNVSRGEKQAISGVQTSLKQLNISYVDLMLIHRPDNDPVLNDQMWAGLEEALNKSLVHSIGVSNFNITQLERLMQKAKIVPAMNQVESHPQKNQRQLIDYCKSKGIHVTAFSPLGSGTLITNPTIEAIGKKHKKSAALVMVRWQIERGVVAIPKSTKKERIKENIDVFDFSLTDEEMKTLEDMK